ncbi:MAG: M20 family metallo-hydrolase [Rhizobiaceae bacterium]
MDKGQIQSRVSGDRLWSRLHAMAQFGGTADGGVDRPALSDAEIQARAQLVAWGRDIGLRPFTDAIGNLFLRLPGKEEDLSPVLAGSHIDSQPTGGKYDGVYGVLAAMEAVQAIVESGSELRRPVEIVAWTNEEGSRFAPGMNGSTAFCRPETLPEILSICDADEISVATAVERVLASDDDIPLRPLGRVTHCYIEPHIEQATALESAGRTIGVVSGIQGTRRYRIRIFGKAGHAGTEPMEKRQDALIATARAIEAMEAEARGIEDFKFTVGMLEIKPNAPSVIPEEAYFSIDIRHPDSDAVDRMDGRIREILDAARGSCKVDLRQIAHAASVMFCPDIQTRISDAADRLGVSSMPVFSAAGHDARQLSAFCPSGMIFIPCRGGISHNPAEQIEPDHALAGVRVLTQSVAELAAE